MCVRSRLIGRFCVPRVTPEMERGVRKPLTDVFVRSLEAPLNGRLGITDLRCNGLTLRVTKRGVKSWSFSLQREGGHAHAKDQDPR